MVASHLKDDISLVAATHVCHLWRTALLSYPRLWSDLSFANEKRALAFLERSRLAPLYIDLTGAGNPSETVKESLRTIGARVTALRGRHSLFLDGILDQSTSVLELLDLIEVEELVRRMQTRSLPSLRTLIVSGSVRPPFRTPYLTTFRFTSDIITPPPQGGVSNFIVNFLRDCPLLEEVYVKSHEGGGSPQDSTIDDLISIPYLRSFTHASSFELFELSLFNRLSLPPTCQVVFATDARVRGKLRRFPIFPTLQNPFNLSDIACTKIMARSHNPDPKRNILHATFTVELVNSRRTRISFEVKSSYPVDLSEYSIHGFLNVSKRDELCSAKTLCLDHLVVPETPTVDFDLLVNGDSITQALENYRNLKTLIVVESARILFLIDFALCLTVDTLVVYSSQVKIRCEAREVDIIGLVGGIAMMRQRVGSPIKALTLVFRNDEAMLRERQGELEKLKNYAGHVQVVSGADALDWDVDEYFLG